MTKEIRIAPSILSADFSKMGEEVKSLGRCGTNLTHKNTVDGNRRPTYLLVQYCMSVIRRHCTTKIKKIRHLRTAQLVSLLFVPFAERNGHKGENYH